MTQDAKVIKILPGNRAEVIVVRATACGSNCSNCESCIYDKEMHTEALNKAGASVGDNVIIESKTKVVMKAALLAYIFPIVMLLLGFIIASKFGAGEGVSVLVAFIALAVSILVIFVTQRKKPNIGYDIVRIVEESEAND